MTICMRHGVLCTVAAAGMALAGAPAADKAPPATATARKKLSYKVQQAPAFVALAEKARGLRGVHATGHALMEDPSEAGAPRKVTFQTWTTPTAARCVHVQKGETTFVVYDGRFAYKFTRRAKGAGAGGRRSRVTERNYYDTLTIASIYCDAARGYTNLGDAARFEPIGAVEDLAKDHPKLQWFQVVPKTEPRHALMDDLDVLTLGISPDDGLVRAMRAEASTGDKKTDRMRVTLVFDTVRHGPLKPNDLKLPAEAAGVTWEDDDADKEIPTPKAVIATDATEKKEK